MNTTPSIAVTSATSRGQLLLVGIGPGGREQMTLQALTALQTADIIIGHTTYIRLIADLLHAHQQVIRRGMTAELERAQLAVQYAETGHTVALISSGDSGIYGMASVVFELLIHQQWQPATGICVEVIPGATALTTCAALVGAPLSHDFCAISLSDLLTPWVVIARRLYAAALADFVVVLYNPSSGQRVRHIHNAQQLLLTRRDQTTPVAIIHAAYRPDQWIHYTTLAELPHCELNMLTTVIVGNSHTQLYQGQFLMTPRGYTHKYSFATGTEHAPVEITHDLAGFSAQLHASHLSAAQLAAHYHLPETYLQALLNTPTDAYC